MRNKTFLLALSLLGLSYHSPLLAFEDSDLYLLMEGGASYSRKAKFNPPPPWDVSPEGYGKKLQSSELIGAGIGFKPCPIFATELKASHRNSFKYRKFQSSTQPLGNKIRFFEFKNTTVMADFLFPLVPINQRCFNICNRFSLSSYVNVGLGLAYNSIDNFRSLQLGSGRVFSMMLPYTKKSFAYQLGLGVDLQWCDWLTFGLAYRYLNGGKIRTNRYVIDNPDSQFLTSGITAPVWKAKFKTNEILLRLLFPI